MLRCVTTKEQKLFVYILLQKEQLQLHIRKNASSLNFLSNENKYVCLYHLNYVVVVVIMVIGEYCFFVLVH